MKTPSSFRWAPLATAVAGVLVAGAAQAQDEQGRVISSTEFNNQKLLDGTGGNGSGVFSFQVGAETATDNQITVTTTNVGTTMTTATTDGTTATLGTDSAGALAAMGALDTAIDAVTSARADFGAVQNRFDTVIANHQLNPAQFGIYPG